MWTSDISSIVFTRIKTQFPAKLKTKYPDLTFTTSNKAVTQPKFPNVYVYLMPGMENGLTLERTAIEGGLFTFQIDVTDSQSQNRADEVMGAILTIMKKMCFSVVAMPSFDNTDSTFRSTARFRRNIAKDDIL